MNKFKIGEIAIIVNPDQGTVTGFDSTGFNGQECEVIGFDDPLNMFEYIIDVSGSTYYVMETELRKKPDNEEAGSWTTIEALTNWNPTKEKVQ